MFIFSMLSHLRVCTRSLSVGRQPLCPPRAWPVPQRFASTKAAQRQLHATNELRRNTATALVSFCMGCCLPLTALLFGKADDDGAHQPNCPGPLQRVE